MDTNTANILFVALVVVCIVGCVWAQAWSKVARDRVYYSTKAARDGARGRLIEAKQQAKLNSKPADATSREVTD